MKIGILAPSDFKGWKIRFEDYELKLNDIVESLKEHEIIITPTKESVPELVGSIYKSVGGAKLSGIIPMDDTEFGIDHLDEFSVDEIINSSTWRNNACKYNDECDILLVLGFSAGVLPEVGNAKWFNKPKILIVEDFITQKLPEESIEQLDLHYIKYDELEPHLLEKKK